MTIQPSSSAWWILLPSSKQVAQILEDGFYLPFAHRAAYEQLREAAGKLVARYMGAYGDDLMRVWMAERPFELHLDNGIVSGRADVILDREGGEIGSLALVDYKTSTDPRSDNVYAFQLAIYAAAGLGEGLNVRAAYLHDLSKGDRVAIPVLKQVVGASARANELIKGMLAKKFDAAPEMKKCVGCDVRFVCKHGPAR